MAEHKRNGRGGSMALRRKKKVLRKKVCKFCIEKVEIIDYKDVGRLQRFITEKGKIIPRKISGNCSSCQRHLANAIKLARQVALLPYTVY